MLLLCRDAKFWDHNTNSQPEGLENNNRHNTPSSVQEISEEAPRQSFTITGDPNNILHTVTAEEIEQVLVLCVVVIYLVREIMRNILENNKRPQIHNKVSSV